MVSKGFGSPSTIYVSIFIFWTGRSKHTTIASVKIHYDGSMCKFVVSIPFQLQDPWDQIYSEKVEEKYKWRRWIREKFSLLHLFMYFSVELKTEIETDYRTRFVTYARTNFGTETEKNVNQKLGN